MIGCNWLVCLGVWLALAATDLAGKILGSVLPITAFVALGFDHVVANMVFLPLAMWQHVPGVSITRVVANLIFAFLGNAVGAGIFVAGGYWCLYLQGRPAVPATTTRCGSEPRPGWATRGATRAGKRLSPLSKRSIAFGDAGSRDRFRCS